MEETDEIVLHYTMLEYLFTKRKLASSCFNHTWEDFLNENQHYDEWITSTNLKLLFWCKIATNIRSYELLTDEQEIYFNPEAFILDTEDKELMNILENNEPKLGIDYWFWKTHSEFEEKINDQASLNIIEETEDFQNIYKIPVVKNVEEPMDIDRNEKVNVIDEKPKTTYPVSSTLQAFKSILLDQNDTVLEDNELSTEEIITRLENFNFDTKMEYLKKIPRSVRIYLQDYKLLKESSRNTVYEDEILLPVIHSGSHDFLQTNSSIDIPELHLNSKSSNQSVKTPQQSLTRSASETTISRSRRKALQVIKSANSTPLRRGNRRALVPEPALNLKMSQFMKRHNEKMKK